MLFVAIAYVTADTDGSNCSLANDGTTVYCQLDGSRDYKLLEKGPKFKQIEKKCGRVYGNCESTGTLYEYDCVDKTWNKVKNQGPVCQFAPTATHIFAVSE
eukprot:NODE_1539_length_878_cov_1.177150.p2 type:complete len:101 gc:universal NODE_1539_length_878_cov_1.177150:860-558(-)